MTARARRRFTRLRNVVRTWAAPLILAAVTAVLFVYSIPTPRTCL